MPCTRAWKGGDGFPHLKLGGKMGAWHEFDTLSALVMTLVLFNWVHVDLDSVTEIPVASMHMGPVVRFLGPGCWVLGWWHKLELLRYVKMERTIRSGKLERCSPSQGASAQFSHLIPGREMSRNHFDKG